MGTRPPTLPSPALLALPTLPQFQQKLIHEMERYQELAEAKQALADRCGEGSTIARGPAPARGAHTCTRILRWQAPRMVLAQDFYVRRQKRAAATQCACSPLRPLCRWEKQAAETAAAHARQVEELNASHQAQLAAERVSRRECSGGKV